MRVKAPVLYVNQVGGNDELIFDGGSFVTTAGGTVGCQLAFAKTDLACWELGAKEAMGDTAIPGDEELLLRNLVLGVRDYAHKCGFRSALLGLSGGIDSALVAVIAAAALGADNVQVHADALPLEFRGFDQRLPCPRQSPRHHNPHGADRGVDGEF